MLRDNSGTDKVGIFTNEFYIEHFGASLKYKL
jgi:hypothetical protein